MDLPDVKGVLIAGIASILMGGVSLYLILNVSMGDEGKQNKRMNKLVVLVFLITAVLVTLAIFFLFGGKNE